MLNLRERQLHALGSILSLNDGGEACILIFFLFVPTLTLVFHQLQLRNVLISGKYSSMTKTVAILSPL